MTVQELIDQLRRFAARDLSVRVAGKEVKSVELMIEADPYSQAPPFVEIQTK